MAILFLDGFDHYTSPLQKWTSVLGNAPTIAGGSARFGAGGLNCVGNTGNRGVRKNIGAGAATMIMGFAFNVSAFNATTNTLIAAMWEGTTSHLELYLLGGQQKIQVTRNATGLGASTSVISPGVWYYVEWKASIHDSTGTVELRLNGVTEINLTGQDTRNGGTGIVDGVSLQALVGTGTVPSMWYDDLYVCDTTGGVADDFLGDIRVQAILPSGNGNSSVLVGSDGNSTDNYLLVDETVPDDDTTYVQSATPGDKDTYTFGDLTPTSGTVHGIQVLPRSRKDDAGVRSIVSVARHSGTEEDGPVQTLTTSYQTFPDVRHTKPGGGAWSISDVNGAEFGVKVNA